MKKFFLKVGYFFIPILILLTFFDLCLRSANSSYKEKYNGVLKNKDSVEILVLGNSHANYGVNPEMFDFFAYNLANVNQSIYFDKRIALSLLPIENLKYVFISIDYHSLYFSDQGELRNYVSYYGNHVKYKNNNYLKADVSPFLFVYPPEKSFSIFKRALKQNYTNSKTAINYEVEKGVNVNNLMVKGFAPREGQDASSFTHDEFYSRANLFNTIVEEVQEKNLILKDLNSFIVTLKKNNITPILFTSPSYSEYNLFLNKSIARQNLKDINQICTTHNVDYWNFMNSNQFIKSDFFDPDHLNDIGARKFGKILNDSLNKLMKKI